MEILIKTSLIFNEGVAIIIAVKIRNKVNKSSEIYRTDMWGKRQEKFDTLNKSSLENIKWQKINLDQNLWIYF